MKQRNLIYNVVGLPIGMLFILVTCSDVLHHDRAFTSLWMCAIGGLVGIGSFANLANRNLGRGATITLIAGYFISILLIPFGVWGIVLMLMDQKRSQRRRG